MKTKMLLCSVLAVASTADASTYFGFYYGPGEAPQAAQYGAAVQSAQMAQLHLTPAGVSSVSVDRPRGFALSIEHDLTAHLAAELAYHDFGETHAHATGEMLAEGNVQPFDHATDIGANGPSLAMLARWPLSSHGSVYGRLGVLRAHVTATARLCGGECTQPRQNSVPLVNVPLISGTPDPSVAESSSPLFSLDTEVSYRRDAFGPFASVGVSFSFFDDYTVRLEYSAYRLPQSRIAIAQVYDSSPPPLDIARSGTTRFLMFGFTERLGHP